MCAEYMSRPNPVTGALGLYHPRGKLVTYWRRDVVEREFGEENTDALFKIFDEGISKYPMPPSAPFPGQAIEPSQAPQTWASRFLGYIWTY
jgi:hypothetical protein